ncbi:sialidase family protein [Williamsia serinedens]|uniref:Neuraminidase (Sialidase) n=1 Tax=Williamsia serinedens TaxID=391736 RepID=A0ABT1H559_9NOCA|nr:exo-alpha-sialidase [Williamsia serinedens]MCP2162374.1 putative neuraminidase (sialidase) [Williamsia serinedens]
MNRTAPTLPVAAAGDADGKLRDVDGLRVDALLPAPAVQNHAANLCVLPDGTLACVWFAGTQEGVPDISVWMSRLEAGSDAWTEPVQLSDDRTRSEQNPVLHVVDDHVVWLLWTSQRAGDQDTARVCRRISHDGGRTWGDGHVLIRETEAGGVFVRQPIMRLPSGRLLLPIFHCVRVPGSRWVGDRDDSAVLISDDAGATWREVAVPDSVGCVHMNIGRLSDGTLVALFRSRWADSVYRSVSHDDGDTWVTPAPTEVPNNNSSIQFVVLDGDRLAMVFNDSSAADATARRLSLYDEIDEDGGLTAPGEPGEARSTDVETTGRTAFWGAPRAPMTLALSDDGGVTWPHRRDIETGDGYCLSNNSRDGLNREFSYPSIVATETGLHVAFTRYRQAIEYVRLQANWVSEETA